MRLAEARTTHSSTMFYSHTNVQQCINIRREVIPSPVIWEVPWINTKTSVHQTARIITLRRRVIITIPLNLVRISTSLISAWIKQTREQLISIRLFSRYTNKRDYQIYLNLQGY
jgi:hypothetical protein